MHAAEPITAVHLSSLIRLNSRSQVLSSSFVATPAFGAVAMVSSLIFVCFEAYVLKAFQRSSNCTENSRAVPQKTFMSMAP